MPIDFKLISSPAVFDDGLPVTADSRYLTNYSKINVKSAPFNATGNGITDDTVAIQSAITLAPNNAVIYFPPGSYVASNLTNLNKRLHFVGEGPETSILFAKLGTTGTLLDLSQSTATTGESVVGLSFDLTACPTMTALRVHNWSSDGLVQYCKFRKGTIGLDVGNCDSLVVNEITCTNQTSCGIHIGDDPGFPTVSLSHILITLTAAGTLNDGILIDTWTAGIWMDDVKVIVPTTTGFICNNGIRVSSDVVPSGANGHFVQMTNCATDGVTGPGLTLKNVRSIQSTNSFWGCLPAASAPGVQIDGGRDYLFSNNWIAGSGINFLSTDAGPNRLIFNGNMFPVTAGVVAVTFSGATAPTLLDWGRNIVLSPATLATAADLVKLTNASARSQSGPFSVLTDDAAVSQTFSLVSVDTGKKKQFRVTGSATGTLQILSDAGVVIWELGDNGVIGIGEANGPNFGIVTGSPEGTVTAPIGSMRLRTDGGTSTTLYVKESGAGNTGWVGK